MGNNMTSFPIAIEENNTSFLYRHLDFIKNKNIEEDALLS